ncbi:MAG: DUF2330 domain-containing protein [Candidatus Wallbacteria bacterium]|nr:DUF2330 domain-containing protein [Candidatus Wallbacteria bacterium]
MVRRAWVATAVVAAVAAGEVWGACCYFSAQDRDVNQPGQKAFITWEPKEKKESFTVQPAFEGDARDFGMVIPTPGQPKLDEMPRDFFKWLAVYTILLPMPERVRPEWEPVAYRMARSPGAVFEKGTDGAVEEDSLGVTVLEKGVVGSLDYKIITATDANGLFQWLKENRYKYAGDESTLDHYIRQKWFFTVMKIDAKQMKTGPDGSYQGEVTPTRFAFASEKLIYPLKITQISVKKNTEALFYVQSPEQMDLEGDWSWAWSYRVMWLNSGTVCISQKQMTDEERRELEDRQRRIEEMRREVPGFDTTKLDWAKRLGEKDAALMEKPLAHYAQAGMPDAGKEARVVGLAAMKEELWAGYLNSAGSGSDTEFARQALARLDTQYPPEKGSLVRVPGGAGEPGPAFWWFPNREAPAADVEALAKLKGVLTPGAYLCKFRKTFLKEEMKRDLELVPVAKGSEAEYYRVLPQSPP